MISAPGIKKTLLAGLLIGLLPLQASAFNPPVEPDPEYPSLNPPPTDGTLPPVTSVDKEGPFETAIDRSTGPGGFGWVVRPANLGEGGVKHPVFIWGPGGSLLPAFYENMLRKIASHGFVIYSQMSTSAGSEMTAAIDWLIAENEEASSAYFGTLNTDKIATGGHSLGSVASFNTGADPRLTTTIHVAGGSFDGDGHENLHRPAAYICGKNDFLATPNCEQDYANTTDIPVWYTVMDGSGHLNAPRDGLPMILAWLRWHLAGESQLQNMFIGPDCDFCTPDQTIQHKNW